MQVVRLGERVLGIRATAAELAQRGIVLAELDAQALLQIVGEVCRQEEIRPTRADRLEARVSQNLLTLLCFLLPPERECFRFDGLGEALDALQQAGAPRSCALLRFRKDYVAVAASAGCGARLSEFASPMGDRAAARVLAQGEVLAEGRRLAALLRRRRR